MRPAARAGVLFFCCILAAGCSARFEAFPFRTAEGGMIDIWQPAGGGARAAPLFHAPAEKSTPLYHLGAAVVTATGQAFAITYATGLRAAQLVLYSDRSTVSKRVPLPPTSGNPVRFLVDL